MKHLCNALLLLAGTLFACVARGQNYSFSVIQDGLVPTEIQRPYSITDSGTILIQPYSRITQSAMALLVSEGKIQPTEQYNPSDQYFALSNSGYMVGLGIGGVYVIDDVYYNQTFINVPTGDTVYPCGINKNRVVVGMGTSPTLLPYGWLWNAGTFEKFVYPGSTGCTLNGINDLNDLVGTIFLENRHDQFYAFTRINGHYSTFTVPGCIDPNPSAINNKDVVVGTAVVSGSNPARTVGFVRAANGKVTLIDYRKYAPPTISVNSTTYYLTGYYTTEVCGVNSAGQIVGMFSCTYLPKSGGGAQTEYIPFLGTPD